MRFTLPLIMLNLILCSLTVYSKENTGAKVFAASCKSCHETGKKSNDAPQLNEIDEWKNRSSGGKDALYKSAIEGSRGYFVMPAKGGNPSLTDDEVKASVDYMLKRAKIK